MKIKKEIVRYLMVAPFVGSADFGVYYLLIHFLPYSVSKAISYVISNGIGYLFNKYWIFKKKRSSYPEAARYLILDVLLLGFNVIANQIILNVWPHAVFLALVIAGILTMLLSFVSKKWWVFKSHG
ncbi:MAG: hypothetical protein UW69_C0009G0004 [Microgenomates group bacterium GW2011_GWA2_44_7]|nr:MAG: hypothetical protein UW69_C0009G0004 [Microgenomates group bacterium GW2011_GWA2_44_7]